MSPHRRGHSMNGNTQDPERGRSASSSALLAHMEDRSDLEDSDPNYHRISLQSLEPDPLDSYPATPKPKYYNPRPTVQSWLSQASQRLRTWKRRKIDQSSWPLSGETSDWEEKQADNASTYPLRTTIFNYALQILIFLVPSFLQHRFVTLEEKPRRVHPTGYLDGLRGLAALFVFWFHYSNNIYDQVKYAYGAPTDKHLGDNDHFMQLPFIRIFHAGPAVVSVFFIVSGFALSIKPVKQMRSGDYSGLLSTLQSATFRRPLRLFLPCFVSTFCVFLLVRAGTFESTRFIAESHHILTGRRKSHIDIKGSFSEQFVDWFWTAVRMMKFFYWETDEYQGFYSLYDPHLWTIPIELRASLVLFITQLAFARFRPAVRVVLTTFCIICAVYLDRWELLLFWGGFILADLNAGFLNPSRQFKHPPSQLVFQIFMYANFILGIFFACYPDRDGDSTPGYMFISTLIPSSYSQDRRFWQGIGGLQIVLAVSSLPRLSRVFASAIPHYLGQISYSLYLVHGTVNHLVGYWLLYFAYVASGQWSNVALKMIMFTIALVFNTCFAIWMADIFMRLGELPCVKLARWIEELLLEKRD